MTTVFKPLYVAEKCFLSEALMWVAFRRMPEDIPADGGDARFHPDNDEYAAIAWSNGFAAPFEPDPEECYYAGLPIHPEFTDDTGLNAGSTRLLADIREAFAKKANEDALLWLDEQIARARAFDAACADWKAEYEKYLELAKSRLFIALREGTLKAQGRRIPGMDAKAHAAEMRRIHQNKQYWTWQDIEYEDIPAGFWRTDGIKWTESAAVDATSHFMHIIVDVREIFSVFSVVGRPRAQCNHTQRTISSRCQQHVLDGRRKSALADTHPQRSPPDELGSFLSRNHPAHPRRWSSGQAGILHSRYAGMVRQELGEIPRPQHDLAEGQPVLRCLRAQKVINSAGAIS